MLFLPMNSTNTPSTRSLPLPLRLARVQQAYFQLRPGFAALRTVQVFSGWVQLKSAQSQRGLVRHACAPCMHVPCSQPPAGPQSATWLGPAVHDDGTDAARELKAIASPAVAVALLALFGVGAPQRGRCQAPTTLPGRRPPLPFRAGSPGPISWHTRYFGDLFFDSGAVITNRSTTQHGSHRSLPRTHAWRRQRHVVSSSRHAHHSNSHAQHVADM